MKILTNWPVATFVLVVVTFSIESLAAGWSPDLEFKIEGGDLEESLTWISGFSYARDSLYRRKGCLDSNGSVGSRDLVGILNERFNGEDITSEQATSALDEYLFHRYEDDCF